MARKRRRKLKFIPKLILFILFLSLGYFAYSYFSGGNDDNGGDNIDNKVNNKNDGNTQKETGYKQILLDIEPVYQYPDYPTGCESVSLYMLLNYYGIDVTVDDIIDELPKGPVPYGSGDNVKGANPEKEFVGNPKSKYSYGVFNEPIRQTANKFKEGALTKKNASIDDLYKILLKKNPIEVWFTTDMEEGIIYREQDKWYDYETGEIVRWPRHEHAILVTGIDSDYIYYNDPNTGKKEKLEIDEFNKFFQQMEGRIVYYNS